MELILKNMEGQLLYKLNLKFNHSMIYGIAGDGKDEFLSMFYNLSFDKGIIMIDNERLLKKNYSSLIKEIKTINQLEVLSTVEETIQYFLLKQKLKRTNQKIISSLKLVGLDDQYLDKKTSTLSTTEKIMLSLACELLGEFKILIIDGLFEQLDRKLRQKIFRILLKLKEKKEVMICVGSNDLNILYQYTDKMILFSNKEVILETDTNELSVHIDLLIEKKFDIPDVLMITYLAKKKGIKIDYHKDVRDLMKDVYKHV